MSTYRFGSSSAGSLRARFVLATVAAAVAATITGCSKPADPGKDAPTKAAASSGKGTPADAAKPLSLAPEDTITIKSGIVSGGPALTGSIQPERRADLRAEISSIVMTVAKENGDPVKRGDLLVRLDDSAIRENLNSADAGVRAATQAYEQAKRQFDRATTLRQSGMVSTAALEDAETRRNAASSELEAAKTRAAQARQQLTRTEVRAPFDGVVSDRKVSAGDTAQIGKELLKVIDPNSMRIEALISADSIGSVKAGQAVRLRVNGFDNQEFAGQVRRVNPSANPTTRQVEVLIDFADRNAPKLAGLYAEGRVLTESSNALMVPATSVIRDGERAEVWKVEAQALKRVAIDLGERDARTGEFALKSGLSEGDQLIRYPSAAMRDGQKVAVATAVTPTPLAAKPVDAKPVAAK